MNQIYPDLNSLVSHEGFVKNPQAILSMEKRMKNRLPLEPYEEIQYGALLNDTKNFSLTSYAIARLASLSSYLQTAFFRQLTIRFQTLIKENGDKGALNEWHQNSKVLPLLFPGSNKIWEALNKDLIEQRLPAFQLLKLSTLSPAAAKILKQIPPLYQQEREGLPARFKELKQLASASADSFRKAPFSAEELHTERALLALYRTALSVKNINALTYIPHTPGGNLVNPLYNCLWGEPFAYYKESPTNTSAPAIMERLIWDLATIFKVTDQFNPTRTIRSLLFQPEEIQEEGKPTRLKFKFGSLQPAVKGILLAKAIDTHTVDQVDFKAVIKTLITHLVFGSYDLHPTNLFLTLQRTFCAFDNTRTLCQSNGIINCQGMLIASFRAGLLELNCCYQELTERDWEEISSQLVHFQLYLNDFERFLKTPMVRLKVASLPENWFNTETVIAALKERLKRLQQAENERSLLCLRDLILAVHPELKFFWALFFTQGVDAKTDLQIETLVMNIRAEPQNRPTHLVNIQKYVIPYVSGTPHDLEIILGGRNRIDLQKIKGWCEDPSLSFEAILVKIAENLDFNTKSIRNIFTDDTSMIRDWFSQKAAIESKDTY